jgi:hypothetical protein
MWKWLASFLGGPVINGLIGAYKAKLEAGNTADRIAADLAARELAVQQAETVAQSQLKIAEIGHPWEVEKLFGYVTLAFYTKCLIWDAMLHLGSTDAIKGTVADWSGYVIMFYFGKRGIENVVRIIKR